MNLNPHQEKTVRDIEQDLSTAKAIFHETMGDVTSELTRAGKACHRLYLELLAEGKRIEFEDQFVANRRCDPEDPRFFQHLHAVEEFLKGIRV